MKQVISRRQYLRAAGATIALPLLPSLAHSQTQKDKAPAQTTSSHPRMMCIGVALGMYANEWTPADAGLGDTVPKLIEPLKEFRDDLTIFSNLDHPNVKGGHRGVPAFLSGVYKPERVGQSTVIRNQITVDQFAAARVGKNNRFASLQLSVAEPNANDLLSWSNKGVSLPGQSDALAVYGKLFVNDPHPEVSARAMKSGRSILDVVNQDAKRVSRRLSRADRAILDQYLTSVRDVERGISRQLEWLTTPKPGVPPLKSRPTLYHENFDLMLDLTALAFQTDSTRVVSLMMPAGGLRIDGNGVRSSNYHNWSHHGKDPSAVEKLIAVEQLHTASLAKFLQRLKETPTDRGNLLDCTQVLFGSGLGNGSSHSNRDLPVLIAGGGHQHKGHIRCAEGTPLTNLFVSMLHRMDVQVDSFADSNGDFDSHLSRKR